MKLLRLRWMTVKLNYVLRNEEGISSGILLLNRTNMFYFLKKKDYEPMNIFKSEDILMLNFITSAVSFEKKNI